MAIDPPPPESDAPLLGNPILTRGTTGRRRSGGSGSKIGWQVALPVAAVVVIAGAASAYYFAHSSQTQPLMTNPPAAASAVQPPPAVASTAPPTAAPARPTEAAPPAAAPRHEHVTRLARAERTPHHAAVRRARSAEDQGADVSATAPVAAPSPPPVISPPPAQ
jgi:cytoskeletal protein RodZ